MSENNNLKISLITLTYNSSHTLESTLKSVSEQDYKEIEHIIVDAYSTDETPSIIEKYKSEAKINVKISQQKPEGIYSALNHGIELSTGEIVGVIHSDDYFKDRNSVKFVMDTFKESTTAVFGNIFMVNNRGKVLRYWNDSHSTDARGLWWMPPHVATYMRRSLFKSYGMYDQSYEISGDFEFFCRLPRSVINDFIHLNETLIFQRTGGASLKLSNFYKKNYEDMKILNKYSENPFRDFISKKISKLKQYKIFQSI